MKRSKGKECSVEELLKDTHPHFFFLTVEAPIRLKLWAIESDGIIIDLPYGAPMRKTVLGYIPSIDGRSVYEIEGSISSDRFENQQPNTIRVQIDPSNIKKVNRRMMPRHSFTPPLGCRISSDDGDPSLTADIDDLSAGGLRIEMDDQLDPSKKYRFDFEIEDDDEVCALSLVGKVVYEVPTDHRRAYGIKFVAKVASKSNEADIEEIDKTVDLMKMVNRLIVKAQVSKS